MLSLRFAFRLEANEFDDVKAVFVALDDRDAVRFLQFWVAVNEVERAFFGFENRY